MKSTGITRKVDDLGRIVIPAGVRRNLGIREGDQVEVHVDGEQVILTKPVNSCVFCQNEEDLQPYRDKVVCRGCVASVGVLDENLRRQRTLQQDGTPAHVQAVPDDGTRPTQPLPSWTEDAGRRRPPLGTAPSTDAPAASARPVPATDPADPRPPAPAHAQRIEPVTSEPPAQDREPQRDEPRRDDRRDDPPASTAW